MDSRPRLPPWLKVPLPGGPRYRGVHSLIERHRLHTVCQEARCPNMGQCFEEGTATFLILGDVCTRRCRFCAITSGRPFPSDPEEPRQVAEAVRTLGLRYAVVTSVTRDDLPDGGAAHFAATVTEIMKLSPHCLVEVLIPDFEGSEVALRQVVAAGPRVLNHNVETVPSLYPLVRPGGDYGRSLELLHRAKKRGATTKSGMMLGLGEGVAEVHRVMDDLRQVGCDLLTLGQYLRPSREHLPVARFYSPEEFDALAEEARALGFSGVEAGPLVRSSYHAHRQASQIVAETHRSPQS